MAADIEIDSLTFVQRLTLLGITGAALDGDDPVDSRELRERCERILDRADAPVVSQPSERDVMSALSALGAEPFVNEEQSDQSPTGKGRPQYTLSTAPQAVLDALEADGRLSPALENLRQ